LIEIEVAVWMSGIIIAFPSNIARHPADGRAVAAVSIKGAAGTIAGHAAVLQRLVARSAALSVFVAPESTPSLLSEADVGHLPPAATPLLRLGRGVSNQ
jgi:hypothetical protein